MLRLFWEKRPIRQLRLFITRKVGDVAEGLLVDTTLRRVTRAVGMLKEVDKIMDGGLEDFQVAAKIEAENPGIFQKPVLGLLRVFGVAEGVGDNER